jgi:hypothetical protein
MRLARAGLSAQLTRTVRVDRVLKALGNSIESGLTDCVETSHHVLIHCGLGMITVRSRYRCLQGSCNVRYSSSARHMHLPNGFRIRLTDPASRESLHHWCVNRNVSRRHQIGQLGLQRFLLWDRDRRLELRWHGLLAVNVLRPGSQRVGSDGRNHVSRYRLLRLHDEENVFPLQRLRSCKTLVHRLSDERWAKVPLVMLDAVTSLTCTGGHERRRLDTDVVGDLPRGFDGR